MSTGNIIGPHGKPFGPAAIRRTPKGSTPPQEVGQVRFMIDPESGDRFVHVADLRRYMAAAWKNFSAFTDSEFERWESK